jgi:RNA polymerase sigma-70 factor (ECF subfamily)
VERNTHSEKEFRVFYEEHYNNLCRAAWRILREKDGAREIVQEVFIEVWSKGTWTTLHSPKAYLYVAVYNRCIKALGKSKRFVSEESMPQHQGGDFHHKLEHEELERIISQGIDSLPDRCKAIFILSREEEMTYNEIATHLDLSAKTVENQMGIALKKLREHLEKHWQ